MTPVAPNYGSFNDFLEGGITITALDATKRATLAANCLAYYGYPRVYLGPKDIVTSLVAFYGSARGGKRVHWNGCGALGAFK